MEEPKWRGAEMEPESFDRALGAAVGTDDEAEWRVSRKGLLVSAAAGTALLGAGARAPAGLARSLLDAAGPKRGGTLRVGLGSGGNGDTLDAHLFVSRADSIRNINLYDQLADTNAKGESVGVLAQAVESNARGDVWTVRIRDGVEFHNGKTMTADDVLFTIRRVIQKKALGASKISVIDLKRTKKLDKRTIRFQLSRPYSVFDYALGDGYIMGIVPVGYDPRKPVGAGPFKFKSFAPGKQAVFTRHENYWRGAPYLDEIVFLSLPDEAARLNALLSNQVDVINLVPLAQARTIEGSGRHKLLIAKAGGWNPFVMNTAAGPLKDVRVRQAMRLIADRPLMLKQALNGHGSLGNDLYARWDPAYAREIPQRTQDLERAKSLLKKAGQQDLAIELAVAPVANGMLEAAQVLAQSAAKIGAKITIKKIDIPTLYGPNLFKWPFTVDTWPSLSYAMTFTGSDGPGGNFNETNFDDPEMNRILNTALRTTDPARRRQLYKDAQAIQHERGGYLIWSFEDTVDAYSSKVAGFVKPDRSGYGLGGARFNKVHFV